jgi:uncharacterized protein YukE
MALVKITQEAVDADRKMQQTINGSLVESINKLSQQGKVLSDPAFWEGGYAREFRAQWPDYERKLKAAQEALQELQRSAEQVHKAIVDAGGGS